MASSIPLSGIELIDCATASVKNSIEVAAENCGYGNDLEAFDRELKQVGHSMGLKIEGFRDLVAIQQGGEPKTLGDGF